MSDSKYDDIIGLPHYEPKHHPRMPMHSRAAQFAPFAALTGHGAAISETARLTDSMEELSDEEKHALSRKLSYAFECHATVTIRYFVPDPRKDGGHYNNITTTIKKIDEIQRKLTLADGRTIPITHIAGLYAHIFDSPPAAGT